MIALGWIHRTAPSPVGFITASVAGYRLLGLPYEIGATARARLAAQVAIFEQGQNFLPTPPKETLSLSDAITFTQHNQAQFDDAFAALGDHGQLSPAISWEAISTPIPLATSGRAWLGSKQAVLAGQQRLAQRAKEILETLTGSLSTPTTEIAVKNNTAQLHICVPRRRETSVRSALARQVRQLNTPTYCLTVTGLWPPIAFLPDFDAWGRRAA